MSETVLAAAGAVLVILVWSSVLRTVFIPRQTSSRAARWTARALAVLSLAVARRLPHRLAGRLLDFCAPLILFTVAVEWVAGLGAGFALLAAAVDPGLTLALLVTAPLPAAAAAVRIAAVLSTALALVAFGVYLARFTAAYDLREREVARLAVDVPKLTAADRKLGVCLASTPRDRVGDKFVRWADWIIDVLGAHLTYPALVYSRPAGPLSWPSAIIVVIDAAAVVEAVAPSWVPRARLLIEHGSTCVQRLAEQVGIALPATGVSLQGREEFLFNDTVRLASDAGLVEERDRAETWAIFQRIRCQYAPQAMAINHRLMYEVDVTG